MGERPPLILKAIALGKMYTGWFDSLCLCFDLFFSEFLLLMSQVLGSDASAKPSLYEISYLDMLQPWLLGLKT